MNDLFLAVANFLNMAVASPTGTAVAAVALSFLMYLLQKVPAVAAFLAKSVWLEHGAMVFLSVAPAVVVTLTTTASWYQAAVTAVLTFLTAMGVNSVAASVKKA